MSKPDEPNHDKKSMTNPTLAPQKDVDIILFFDGICVMCNQLVHFVLKHDRKRVVRFATLQGNAATHYLPTTLKADLKTVVLRDADGIHTESDAILKLFKAMGGTLSMAYVLYIVPRFLRNFVYRYIANNRYRWFGTTEACALLTEEERQRILD